MGKKTARTVRKQNKKTARRTVSTVQSLGMSDEAVAAKTGRTWKQWIAVLDRAGARRMAHKEIASLLAGQFAVAPWWSQTITGGYERARGLRAKHQMPDGFQISRSRTIAAPAGRLFDLWNDAWLREGWLDAAKLKIRTANRPRAIRAAWIDGRTNVEVLLTERDAGRTQVTVQHSKLPDAATGERMKRYWGDALERLQSAAAT